ncbi:uncharacterized protein M421DRAFT_408446 [Didymella exigua CBS 183.55]|uniref:Transcription factor domain-containing protein n=1 Tax=Didymella exigua CBS 183.55 TaxID=1150837 RepID=A0A6A5RTA1_9PLEO|nr:uncharacterized protein M421DRAFT_408446 [Didymella exigua CBS 183.55]KAF1931062.1 hypothetical protein M421DRAFT_408446 [Didymella exigua CBS 183.55]
MKPFSSIFQGFWTQSNGFRPPDILSRQATRGDFSLQSVLRTEHGAEPQYSTQYAMDDDPIDNGLINFHDATSLFDGFMKYFNPFISQLDCYLHTLGYVRETSRLLLTAVLAAAAKLLHPSLYIVLLNHAKRSTETIHAILILTYWKKPDDNLAWLSVGLAIRMAIELGWHQLGTAEMKPRRTRATISISMQTGKPWMIKRSSYVKVVSDGHSHALDFTNNRLLSASFSLRFITSTHFEMMTAQYVQHQRHEPAQFRSLLPETVTGHGEDCHAFLIPFYGSYARLLLFASPLRASMRLRDMETSVDIEAIWNSCSSALDILKLVSEPLASQLVYFAQDSVHVMIAYATVFLIKLLVSAPAYISNEMESRALESISNNTANVLAAFRAPSYTSCSLQAVFLHNVLAEYASIKEHRTPLHPDVPTTVTDHTILRNLFNLTQYSPPADAILAYDDQNVGNFSSQGPPTLDLDFMNDQVWALIFPNAGFNIDQGAFM